MVFFFVLPIRAALASKFFSNAALRVNVIAQSCSIPIKQFDRPVGAVITAIGAEGLGIDYRPS